eukprot:TRINITY_DN789_c1_g1_i1.p2 TRINITY_DN789_c1_g1~~TRINITY_DN789_c1_g1_i1.p2  ORF type:complete len:411 (+),score=166.88 TRINITY_DN789_c1_g1_i1:79-1233(+)
MGRAGAGARVRTESMIQRLSKKPLQDGFDLWDKDYVLGALRLFQCKLEGCPPFEQAPCLEAIACILVVIEELEEAVEHFQLAAEKYDLVQKKPLACLMRARMAEVQTGPEEAIRVCGEGLADHDAGADIPAAQKPQVARLLIFRADLHGKTKNELAGIKDADAAIALGPMILKANDTVHTAHFTKGQLLQSLDKVDEAAKAFTAATTARPEHFASWEALSGIKQQQGDLDGALQAIDKAFALHGKAALLRNKAFVLSEMGRDDDALKVCDEAIAKPPHEETEALTGPAGSVAILHQAKAAILADSGKLEEAAMCLKEALKCDPQDSDALRMSADINTTLARDYLQQNSIPQFLDNLIAHVLRAKPDAPVNFMVEAIEKGTVPLP